MSIEIVIAAILGILYGVFLELYALLLSGGVYSWNDVGRYGIFVLIAYPLVTISIVGKPII